MRRVASRRKPRWTPGDVGPGFRPGAVELQPGSVKPMAEPSDSLLQPGGNGQHRRL